MAETKGEVGIMRILVLHGWAYSTEKWDNFIDQLTDSGVKAELLKIPGLTEPTNKAWTLDDYVSWLKKKIGNDKVVLIGHSNGGRISLAFSVQYPDNVSQLILIDSAGIYHNELPLRLKRFVFHSMAKAGKRLTSSPLLKKLIYKVAKENDYRDADPLTQQTLVNMISIDLKPLLDRIKAPTLIIWGRQDQSTPLSDGQLMHQKIENSQLYVIDEARHSPQFTHTDKVCTKILEVIQ